MKRLTTLLLFAGLVAGCATPPKKAENLAQKIEKESLENPSVSAPQQDPQPQQLFKDIGNAVGMVAGTGAKMLGDGAEYAAYGLVTLPVAIVSVPVEVFLDCLKILGEGVKFIFPPPPPKVV